MLCGQIHYTEHNTSQSNDYTLQAQETLQGSGRAKSKIMLKKINNCFHFLVVFPFEPIN